MFKTNLQFFSNTRTKTYEADREREPKLFSQKELNAIIEARLARERLKMTGGPRAKASGEGQGGENPLPLPAAAAENGESEKVSEKASFSANDPDVQENADEATSGGDDAAGNDASLGGDDAAGNGTSLGGDELAGDGTSHSGDKLAGDDTSLGGDESAGNDASHSGDELANNDTNPGGDDTTRLRKEIAALKAGVDEEALDFAIYSADKLTDGQMGFQEALAVVQERYPRIFNRFPPLTTGMKQTKDAPKASDALAREVAGLMGVKL